MKLTTDDLQLAFYSLQASCIHLGVSFLVHHVLSFISDSTQAAFKKPIMLLA